MESPDFTKRIERARALFDTESKAALITKPLNIYYLTGFKGVAGPDEREIELLITKDKIHLIMKPFYIDLAKQTTSGYALHGTRGPFNYAPDFSLVKEILEEEHLPPIIAIERANLIVQEEDALTSLGLTLTTIDIDLHLRARKDSWEVTQLKRACAIGDKAFSYILGEVKAGMSEIAVKKRLDDYLLSQEEVDGVSFDAMVIYGPNASDPHRESGDTIIQEGNFLSFDFGVRVNGYCSDMTRVIFIGTPDGTQKKMYATVLKAQKLSLEYAASPLPLQAAQIDIIANEYITEKGFPEFLGHSHGIGTADHERPDLLPTSTDELVPEMVFTVEPGIYLPGVVGIRIEDEMVRTESGIDIFTHSLKDLICIDPQNGTRTIISTEELLSLVA